MPGVISPEKLVRLFRKVIDFIAIGNGLIQYRSPKQKQLTNTPQPVDLSICQCELGGFGLNLWCCVGNIL